MEESNAVIVTINVMTNKLQLTMIRDGRIVAKTQLPDMEVPIQTAINGYATMGVINGVIYIGGINGIVYEIHISGSSKDQLSISVSNVSLGIPDCHIETFIDNDGATAVCFSNAENVVDVIKVHSPSVSRQHSFMKNDFISNFAKLDKDKTCYMHNNTLFKASINEGHTFIETIENCKSPLLVPNTDHYIIINCAESTSEVYVPVEWGNTDTFGIRNGAWRNTDRFLHPCHDTGFATLVYSHINHMVTFYNIYNNFEKTIFLNETLITCVLKEDYLMLLVKDNTCDCKIMHLLNENFDHVASFPILDSDGKLSPLVINNQTIDQNVLIFQKLGHVQDIMIPSTMQVLFDVVNNVSYSNITDDVVLYHGFLPLAQNDVITGKDQINIPSNEGDNNNWVVYVVPIAVVVIILVVILLVVVGIVIVRRRR